jgi:hypothetical protein
MPKLPALPKIAGIENLITGRMSFQFWQSWAILAFLAIFDPG